MSSPLEDVENRHAQLDIGKTGSRIYSGAREDGLSRIDALFVTAAWFYAMIRSADTADQQENDPE